MPNYSQTFSISVTMLAIKCYMCYKEVIGGHRDAVVRHSPLKSEVGGSSPRPLWES